MAEEKEIDDAKVGARVVLDMKIPMWGLMTVAGTAFILAIGLYNTVQNLTEAVKELKITVTSGNTSVNTLTSEMSLFKFRLNTVEADMARLNEAARNQNQKAPR